MKSTRMLVDAKRVCINRESAEAVRVFAGVLKYQWRSCERSRGHESASRGCQNANKGRESACMLLKVPLEALRLFAGPLSVNRGRVSVVEAMKVPEETIRVLIKAMRVPIAVVEVPKEAVIVLLRR